MKTFSERKTDVPNSCLRAFEKQFDANRKAVSAAWIGLESVPGELENQGANHEQKHFANEAAAVT